MPATFDGIFKVEGDPQPNVLTLTSQMNAHFGQHRLLLRGGRVVHTDQGWATECRSGGIGSRVWRRAGGLDLLGLVGTNQYNPVLTRTTATSISREP